MAERPFSFIDHKVTYEGIYIRGIRDRERVEILVPRDEAEMFDWCDPLTDEEIAAREQKEAVKNYWMATDSPNFPKGLIAGYDDARRELTQEEKDDMEGCGA